jgi:S-adenosylmethionine decarboxylase
MSSEEGAMEERKDWFVERNGRRYAGTHLLIDLYGAEGLDDPARIEAALRAGAAAAQATVLHGHFHVFEPNGGVSGVLVLAESHLSIHSWPEAGYAAIDAFMCGVCDPNRAVPAIRDAFKAQRMVLTELMRGVQEPFARERSGEAIEIMRGSKEI